MNRHPLDGDAIAADRHYERLHERGHGEEEGAVCNRDGCDGVIQVVDIDSLACSCHVVNPCFRCHPMTATPACDTCGAEVA